MHPLHLAGRILATVFSITFAVLLFPTILDDHGYLTSSLAVLAGVGFIWLAYFGLGQLFGHLYEQGRKDESDDFV